MLALSGNFKLKADRTAFSRFVCRIVRKPIVVAHVPTFCSNSFLIMDWPERTLLLLGKDVELLTPKDIAESN